MDEFKFGDILKLDHKRYGGKDLDLRVVYLRDTIAVCVRPGDADGFWNIGDTKGIAMSHWKKDEEWPDAASR